MLPAIEHYPHPTIESIPAPRARWDLNPDRCALLIHDMQRYFLAPFAGSATAQHTIDNIARILQAARAAGIPVYYTAQPPNQDPDSRGLLTDMWGTGLTDDGGQHIVDDLAPTADDTVLTKWRYDAFERSPLQQLLDEQGRDQLIITGIYAHIGVLTTATSAFMKDIAPFLVTDACADFSHDHHHMAMSHAARTCGVITDTDSVLSVIAPNAS